jgi:hypothetical protein
MRMILLIVGAIRVELTGMFIVSGLIPVPKNMRGAVISVSRTTRLSFAFS